jgi:cbb3-type cytochrome oxidase subunit 3
MEMTPGMLVAILILIGLTLIGIGLWMLQKQRKKNAACSAPVTAELLRYEQNTESEIEEGRIRHTTYYYPVFKYMANGEEHTASSSFGNNKRRWKTGAQVAIHYNPENLDMIRAPGEIGNYFGFVVSTILGLACMAFGILAAAGVLEVNL